MTHRILDSFIDSWTYEEDALTSDLGNRAADIRWGRNLKRIAEALGVPILSFYGTGSAKPWPVDTAVAQDEIHELLRSFPTLRDPIARRRIIAAAEVELTLSAP